MLLCIQHKTPLRDYMISCKVMRRILYLILFLTILYNLLRTDQCQVTIHASWSQNIDLRNIQKNTSSEDVLATHVPMPAYLRGKKLEFHQVFESRPIGHPKQTMKNSNETRVILLWTPWNAIKNTFNYYFLQPGNKTFVQYNCPNARCIVTSKKKYLPKADAVLFHLIDVKFSELPSRTFPSQKWILYNMEPPWQVHKHMASKLEQLNHIFNWTMGYSPDSDVPVTYGYIEQLKNRTSNSSVFREKTKDVVWFVSDCATDSRREKYVTELKKNIDVDVYGKCGPLKCYPSQSRTCYDNVLKDYKFYLSFENAICDSYVTEKFFNVFDFDILPIVFGGANYSNLAPAGTFIDATRYPRPEDLAMTLKLIASDEKTYNGLIGNKKNFKAYLDPWMCRLCDKLHTPMEDSVVSDVKKFFIDDGHCKRWDDINQTFIDSDLKRM